MKKLFIAEKPSVAAEFAKALGANGAKRNGYIESPDYVITWCVGHLVTMSYPEKYGEQYRKWSLATLPFLPDVFKYEVIDSVRKQFDIVSGLLNREDVDCIYICTDSGREGEYIYRLVDEMAGVKDKKRLRVWIDSQTEEEILRGIREARDWNEYAALGASAYLRAKEDYLMGINFSRLLTIKYGYTLSELFNTRSTVISVGRVMSCVLGMTVRREREIRDFVKTPFYRVLAVFGDEENNIEAEWRAVETSEYYNHPALYKENGFKSEEDAKKLIDKINSLAGPSKVISIEKKKESKNPPLLYNLAELQNDCSKKFKINPDETLKTVQELYEKKMVTYPRTDARVLSTAVAKEIYRNISGLRSHPVLSEFADAVLQNGSYKNISKTRYVNDSQITDHYAIIPTGQGAGRANSLSSLSKAVYELICRRFLSIFYPAAEYEKYSAEISAGGEHFFAGFKLLKNEGYLAVARVKKENAVDEEDEENESVPANIKFISSLKKNSELPINNAFIKPGETSPPKRYTSGSMILAMENAGQLIEDEELRSQIKGSGIGTSATRAEILKKLFKINYLALNKKTQVISPTLLGEMIYEVVNSSIKQLLNPELTASWEKGLTYVAEGSISTEEYMVKLNGFIERRTRAVLELNNNYLLKNAYKLTAENYKKGKGANEEGTGKNRKTV